MWSTFKQYTVLLFDGTNVYMYFYQDGVFVHFDFFLLKIKWFFFIQNISLSKKIRCTSAGNKHIFIIHILNESQKSANKSSAKKIQMKCGFYTIMKSDELRFKQKALDHQIN